MENNATRSPSVGWIIAKHLHQVRKFAKFMLRHWTFRWRYDLTHGLYVHLESLRMFLFENETCVLEFVDFVEWNLLRALDDLLSLLSNSRCFIQETMNLRGNVQLTICSGLSFPIENTSHNGDNDRRERDIIVHIQLCRRWNYVSPYYIYVHYGYRVYVIEIYRFYA